jgi:hypothetical protein
MTTPNAFGGYGGGGAWGGAPARPPAAHIRCTFSGTIGQSAAPPEIWAFNVAVAHGAGSSKTADAAKASLEAAAAALEARWATYAVGISSHATLTRVRCASIGDQGTVDKTGGGAFVQGDKVGTTAATGTGANFPFQIALAVSLATARAGAGGRGRYYLPVPVGAVSIVDGLLTTSDQSAHLTRSKAFLDGINADMALQGFGRVSVASSGSVTKGLPAGLSTVTNVRVGRVLDTIRSRRNALLERYVTSPLA